MLRRLLSGSSPSGDAFIESTLSRKIAVALDAGEAFVAKRQKGGAKRARID